MRRVYPLDRLRLLNRLQVREINSNRLAVASHQDTFQLFVGQGIDFLVWNCSSGQSSPEHFERVISMIWLSKPTYHMVGHI